MKSVVEFVTKNLRQCPGRALTKLNRSFKSLSAVFHRAGFSTRMTFRRRRQQVKHVSASATSAPISGTTLQMNPVKFSAEAFLECRCFNSMSLLGTYKKDGARGHDFDALATFASMKTNRDHLDPASHGRRAIFPEEDRGFKRSVVESDGQ